MASYGSGFAQGLNAGSNLVGNAINDYQKMKLFKQAEQDRADTNGLFKASTQVNNAANLDQYMQGEGQANLPQPSPELEQEQQQLAQRNIQAKKLFSGFENASPGDLTNIIMQEYKANGGKINDNTYTLANGVASKLFGIKQKAIKLAHDNKLFDEKIKTNELQQQKYKRDLNQPLSPTGKTFTDFNIPLTEENLKAFNSAKNSKKGLTTNIKEYNYAKQQGYKGSFAEFLDKFKKPNSGTMTPYQQESINIRNDKLNLDKKANRNKNVKYLSENMSDWENLTPIQQRKAVDYYEKFGVTPKIDEEWHAFSKNKYTLNYGDNTEPQDTKASETTPKQKYPDGTTLQGKDGQTYIVKGGIPVLAN